MYMYITYSTLVGFFLFSIVSFAAHNAHYENSPMQYTLIFLEEKIENFIRKKNDIFAEAVLTSTHNLCFAAKIRTIGIPLHTPVLLYKSGVEGGMDFTDMLS